MPSTSLVSTKTRRLRQLLLVSLGQQELGRRIRQARDDAGLTQSQLAELLGLKHPQSISRYERGETEVPQRALDGLPLRVEDPCLRPDEHGRPHARTTCGSATYASNGIPVSRSNASMYFLLVSTTTCSGSSGPGSVLSQPTDSQ